MLLKSASGLLELRLTNRLHRDVNEGTVFLMNFYLNVMAKLQKRKKKTLKNRFFFSKWQSVFNNSKEMLRSSQILHTTAK